MARSYSAVKKREFHAQKTEIRVGHRTYKGKPFLDIREFYWDGKKMKPTKKGVTIPPQDLSNFMKAIEKASNKVVKED